MTEQSQLGPSTEGTVVLDIGGDYGALILHTGADLLLAEIEISRVDGGDLPGGHHHDDGAPPRAHVAVRERRGPGGVQYAAIYPSLPSGDYTLWGVDGQARDSVTIIGGEVAETSWR